MFEIVAELSQLCAAKEADGWVDIISVEKEACRRSLCDVTAAKPIVSEAIYNWAALNIMAHRPERSLVKLLIPISVAYEEEGQLRLSIPVIDEEKQAEHHLATGNREEQVGRQGEGIVRTGLPGSTPWGPGVGKALVYETSSGLSKDSPAKQDELAACASVSELPLAGVGSQGPLKPRGDHSVDKDLSYKTFTGLSKDSPAK